MIRYTGWLCRGMLSATTYSLVGVVNKFLTILLNVILWDKHSSMMGIVAVCLCLGCGTFYEQAPRRTPLDPIENKDNGHTVSIGNNDRSEEETLSLLPAPVPSPTSLEARRKHDS